MKTMLKGLKNTKIIIKLILSVILAFNWLIFNFSFLPFFKNSLQVPEVHAADTFRVTEYYITTGAFTGTTYDLTLSNNLSDNYFVLVRGSRDGNAASYPDNDYIRVYEVPNGTGDLADSGASNVISLSRYVADFNWEGVVTVVECLGNCNTTGFRLLDIIETPISTSSTSGTDTSSASWSDINDVVLFGGFHGGGAEFEAAADAYNDGNAVQTRLYPSSTNTINWTRDSTEDLTAVTLTTFVIEWGSEWTVQRINISGTNYGDGCNATGEYNAGSISSVVRDNTWVWGTGISTESGIGDSASGTIVTLGDGVTQNSSETSVSICGEYAATRNFDVYAMTHSSLTADYRFSADGNSTIVDLAVTVDSASNGYRFGWVTNGCAGSGTAHPRDRFWARYTADTTVTISRGYSGQNFPAWIEGIDFSGITYTTPTTFTQNTYRWYVDNDSADPTDPWSSSTGVDLAENTAVTYPPVQNDPPGVSQELRLRINFTVNGANLSAESKYFKVQYKKATDATCTTGDWYDVQNNGTGAEWDFAESGVTDGATISAKLSDTTSVRIEDYVKSKPSAVNPVPANIGENVEYDFHMVYGATASANTTYSFRMVETDSGGTTQTVFSSYTNCPTLTTEPILDNLMRHGKVYGEWGQKGGLYWAF